MTVKQNTPLDAVLVAIDIAKARNEVLIEVPARQRRRKLSIRNTREDHDRLIGLLAEIGKTVICGFEATGNYHRPIAWRLIQAGFDVRLVSSMAAARTREALHNQLGQERPEGRPSHPAHVADRGDPALSRSAAGRDQRCAGTVQDP